MRIIDKKELTKVIQTIQLIPDLCPHIKDVFKSFYLCKYENCKVVCIGQDPYPQKDVATGILFGNNELDEDKLSPSLKVIKNCVINFELPHNITNFDNTLESWCKQGVLMINSALTCKRNNIGSHVNLWRPFMTSFLKNMSIHESGILYVLFGKQAQTLKPYIGKYNTIIECEHPLYFARTNQRMPNIFKDIDNYLTGMYGETIKWY